MKASTIPFLILMLMSAVLWADPEASTGEASARELESRVAAVTVYADRARVTRTAEVELGAEPVRYVLPALPGWIDEASVRISLEAASGGQIGAGQIRAGQIHSVELLRTFLARPSDDEFRAAEEAVREIEDQLAALDDEDSILESQKQQIEALRVFSVEKMPRDAAMRRVEISEYEETVTFVGSALRETAKQRRRLAQMKRQLAPELHVRQRRLSELRQRAQLEQRSVVLSASGSGKAMLAVTYMIPGATWRPAHELRTGGEADAVTLTSLALIQQTTGEDWRQAEISLATQRSDETLRIPEVEALHLGGGRSLSRWVASSRDSFGVANESYAKHNAALFAINNPDAAGQQAYLANQQAQFDNAQQVIEVFRTLEQRGTTAHFEALSHQTVRGDGSEVRVAIGRVQLPADQRILAAPELSLNAVRILDLSNQADQPFLPGKVSLYVDGAFLGLTDLGFTAPGERFELFLGVVDYLKLTRSLDRRGSELNRRGTRTQLSVSFQLRVENLSDRVELIQLRDRIPVSQTDKIRVSGVKISPAGAPDAKGLLSWSVRLAARESREYRIDYTIEYPTDLPAASGQAHERLKIQLRSLESQMTN